MPNSHQPELGKRRGRAIWPRRRTPIGELPDFGEEVEEARIRQARLRWLEELYYGEYASPEDLSSATQELQLDSTSESSAGSSEAETVIAAENEGAGAGSEPLPVKEAVEEEEESTGEELILTPPINWAALPIKPEEVGEATGGAGIEELKTARITPTLRRPNTIEEQGEEARGGIRRVGLPIIITGPSNPLEWDEEEEGPRGPPEALEEERREREAEHRARQRVRAPNPRRQFQADDFESPLFRGAIERPHVGDVVEPVCAAQPGGASTGAIRKKRPNDATPGGQPKGRGSQKREKPSGSGDCSAAARQSATVSRAQGNSTEGAGRREERAKTNEEKRARVGQGGRHRRPPARTLLIKKGIIFSGLAPVPFDPAVDTELGQCFNCRSTGHRRTQCPKPRGPRTCHNCGRRGVEISTCPRCAKAYEAYLLEKFGRTSSDPKVELPSASSVKADEKALPMKREAPPKTSARPQEAPRSSSHEDKAVATGQTTTFVAGKQSSPNHRPKEDQPRKDGSEEKREALEPNERPIVAGASPTPQGLSDEERVCRTMRILDKVAHLPPETQAKILDSTFGKPASS